MKIDNLKKLKDKNTSLRAVDIEETDMLPTQYNPEDTVPDYVFVHELVNPFFNVTAVNEFAANLVDLVKGTRNVVSLQYSNETVIKILAINWVVAIYIHAFESLIQATKLIAHNDTVVMRELVKLKYGVTDAQINTVINNREDWIDAVEHAKDTVFSKLVNLGHFEDIMEQYFYDFRHDDQAQYTTKICYIPEFVIYKDVNGTTPPWVSDFVNTLTGASTGLTISSKNKGIGVTTITIDSWITDPASWQKRLDDACNAVFNVTEYHAFKVEYNNIYMEQSLWHMKYYKIKHYYSKSDEFVLANAHSWPIMAKSDSTMPSDCRYIPMYCNAASITIAHNAVQSVVAGQPCVISYQHSYSADITAMWIPSQNSGFNGYDVNKNTNSNLVLTRSNTIINAKDKSLVKDAELMAISGYVSDKWVATNVADTSLTIACDLPHTQITGYHYAWSTHAKDGAVNFTTTSASYDAPMAYRCYDNNNSSIEIRRETAASINVTGLPPLGRFYSLGNNRYQYDNVQELYDLYEITPSVTYNAHKYLQHSMIDMVLKIAEGAGVRASNFAQLLDVVSRTRNKS